LESFVLWTFVDCILPQLSSHRYSLWRICSPLVPEIADKILIKAHQMSVRILPVFIPTEEIKEIPDWQLHPSVFRAILARWGPSSIDLFASCASKQTDRFFNWDAADNPEAVKALSQKWDFTLAYAFPPIPLLKRVVKKLKTLRGSFILISPLWEAQTWLALFLSLTVLKVRRLPFRDNLVTDLMMGKPPQILHNLHLVAWRISGGSTPSRTSLLTPEISTRLGGALSQKAATKQPGSPSRDIFVPPTFHLSWCD
jgi:hypothetical protein